MNEPAALPLPGAEPVPAEETYAAVDLGSNSFHLLVARRAHGELRVIDQIKEMVRLGGGLEADGTLDRAVRDRALECLSRFGQRLRGIPETNLRAVGTQTLRRMKNANAFLMVAETALGCPIDVIAGREEARLIYLGVTRGVPGHDQRRLVIDIGGGSTELIVGEGPTPELLESVQYGCVSLTRRFFPRGRLSDANFERAINAARAELQEHELRFRASGWDSVVGTSGTIRAAGAICEASGWSTRHLTPEALDRLRRKIVEARRIDALVLEGLSERREPVIAGGVAMLIACFEAFGIERMSVSDFALREGLLHDLLGRLEHHDPRSTTIAAFMARYGVEPGQARRVRELALRAFDQLAAHHEQLRPEHRELLGWAADLHETGLGISHSHYERHSGYLVEESDMAGFTRPEQLFLAALVRHHRRKLPSAPFTALPGRLHAPLRACLVCLRIAAILCRTREEREAPPFTLSASDGTAYRFALDERWAAGHPLTLADLAEETDLLAPLDIDFEAGFADPPDPAP